MTAINLRRDLPSFFLNQNNFLRSLSGLVISFIINNINWVLIYPTPEKMKYNLYLPILFFQFVLRLLNLKKNQMNFFFLFFKINLM